MHHALLLLALLQSPASIDDRCRFEPVLIVSRSTGGVAGSVTSITICSDAEVIDGEGNQWWITPEELAFVRKEIAKRAFVETLKHGGVESDAETPGMSLTTKDGSAEFDFEHVELEESPTEIRILTTNAFPRVIAETLSRIDRTLAPRLGPNYDHWLVPRKTERTVEVLPKHR